MYEDRENALIEQLKEIVCTNHNPTGEYTWHVQHAYPPATTEEIAQVEALLGFKLPLFLRRLYLEVGNGGFGPGYGLFPLNSHDPLGDSLVTWYLGMKSMTQKDIDEGWADEEEKPCLWPTYLLMLCDWGCNIYSLIDCSLPDSPIFRMDNNVSLSQCIVEAPTLQDWLEAWVRGEQLFLLDWKQGVKIPVAHLGKNERMWYM